MVENLKSCVLETTELPLCLTNKVHPFSCFSFCVTSHWFRLQIKVVQHFNPLTCFLSVVFYAHWVNLYIVGVEARGFMFGPSIALAIGAKFVPLRKPKKLPGMLLDFDFHPQCNLTICYCLYELCDSTIMMFFRNPQIFLILRGYQYNRKKKLV